MKEKIKQALSLRSSIPVDATYISPVFSPLLNIKQGMDDMLFDSNGKRFIDFTSGIAVNAFGHNSNIVYEAAKQQMGKVIHTSNLFTTPVQIQLCKKLVKMANQAFKASHYSSVFLSNSGTEANEAALKFAKVTAKRLYSQHPNKVEIVACRNSFHGRTMGSLSVTGQEKYTKPFSPLMPNVNFVEYNDIHSMKQAVNDNTAAIIVEPLQGEGGLEFMTPEFAHTINALAAKYQAFVIADEVQTGLYRTGPVFASLTVGLQPHLITLAKSLGGGLPLGAVITHNTIHENLQVGDHGTTTGGNPVVCNVALSILKHLQSPSIQILRKQSANKIQIEIKKLCKKYPNSLSPLGSGHLRGIAIPKQLNADAVIREARKRGLLILKTGDNYLRIAPSLICNNVLISRGFKIIKKSIVVAQKAQTN